MQSLLPITGELGSVGMMAMMCSSLFMIIGAAMPVLTVVGGLGDGDVATRAGRARDCQRDLAPRPFS